MLIPYGKQTYVRLTMSGVNSIELMKFEVLDTCRYGTIIPANRNYISKSMLNEFGR